MIKIKCSIEITLKDSTKPYPTQKLILQRQSGAEYLRRRFVLSKYGRQTDIEAAALKNPPPCGTETNTDRGSRLKNKFVTNVTRFSDNI